MNRDEQQIRATAIQLALSVIPHVKIESSDDIIAIAEQIATFINPPRSALVTPVMKALKAEEIDSK